jgi:hypothetical protein
VAGDEIPTIPDINEDDTFFVAVKALGSLQTNPFHLTNILSSNMFKPSLCFINLRRCYRWHIFYFVS